MRLNNAIFLACAGITFACCHLIAGGVLPTSWKAPRIAVPDRKEWYLATYGDFGLDYYVMRFGLAGVDEHIKNADIICSSSSKGLFGYDAALLSEKLSTPSRPVRVYNLSFGFGEGFVYMMEVVKTLDLRDKILIADLTDNTVYYHLTPMASLAMQTQTRFDGYKVYWEKCLTYERDRCFQGRLPRVVYAPEKGFKVTPYTNTAQNFRQKSTGNIQAVVAQRQHEARPGKWTFDFDARLQEPFFEECRRRNIRIIFTSIPADGFDPDWGQRWAERLGHYPHVAVAPEGIELFDPHHMSTKGRQLFSTRLAQALLAHNTAAALIHDIGGPARCAADAGHPSSTVD